MGPVNKTTIVYGEQSMLCNMFIKKSDSEFTVSAGTVCCHTYSE